MITSAKYADIVEDRTASAVSEADLAYAETLVEVGSSLQTLEEQVAERQAKIKELQDIVKEPAPAELLGDILKAMGHGLNVARYYDEVVLSECPWDMDLYILPDTDDWKAKKKAARKLHHERNLARFDDTIGMLTDAKDNDDIVVTKCDVKALKKGGHSVKVHATINQDSDDNRLSFDELRAKIAEKRSRLSDSK